MPENSQKLLPVLVLNFGDVSALQYCTSNFYGSNLLTLIKKETGSPPNSEDQSSLISAEIHSEKGASELLVGNAIDIPLAGVSLDRAGS